MVRGKKGTKRGDGLNITSIVSLLSGNPGLTNPIQESNLKPVSSHAPCRLKGTEGVFEIKATRDIKYGAPPKRDGDNLRTSSIL